MRKVCKRGCPRADRITGGLEGDRRLIHAVFSVARPLGLREQVREQVDGTARCVGTEELPQVVRAALGDLGAAREECVLVGSHCFLDVGGVRDDLRGQRRAVEQGEVGTLAGERRHQVRSIAYQRHAG